MKKPILDTSKSMELKIGKNYQFHLDNEDLEFTGELIGQNKDMYKIYELNDDGEEIYEKSVSFVKKAYVVAITEWEEERDIE